MERAFSIDRDKGRQGGVPIVAVECVSFVLNFFLYVPLIEQMDRRCENNTHTQWPRKANLSLSLSLSRALSLSLSLGLSISLFPSGSLEY